MTPKDFLKDKERLDEIKFHLIEHDDEVNEDNVDEVLSEEYGFSFFMYDMDFQDDSIYKLAMEWEMVEVDKDLKIIWETAKKKEEKARKVSGKGFVMINEVIEHIDSLKEDEKTDNIVDFEEWLKEVESEDPNKNIEEVFAMCKDAPIMIGFTHELYGNLDAQLILYKDWMNAVLNDTSEEKMQKKRRKKKFLMKLKKGIDFNNLFVDILFKHGDIRIKDEED